MAFVSTGGPRSGVRLGAQSKCGRLGGARSVMAVAAAPRIGHGFDLHRLEPDNKLILGGVVLEHDRGCVGHSDGDAVYHCVVDAVLGALSLPDIGQLFPDKDPKWKGAASDVFMRATKDLMDEKGFEIGNVDVTVILEKPKMSPHKDKMRANIASLLECDLSRVNLKAKTHEKVDALGENRAVACHTVALLVPKETTDEDQPPAVAQAEVVPPAQALDSDPVQESLQGMASQLFGSVTSRATKIMETGRITDSGDGASGSAEAHTLESLYARVESKKGADPSTSWTAKLFSKGRGKIAQKVGEEAVETVIAGTQDDAPELVKESADLLYHLCVLWADAGVRPEDVWEELRSREGTSGIAEKASRAAS